LLDQGEWIDELGVELFPGAGAQLGDGFVDGFGCLVGSFGSHGVKGVDDAQDAC